MPHYYEDWIKQAHKKRGQEYFVLGGVLQRAIVSLGGDGFEFCGKQRVSLRVDWLGRNNRVGSLFDLPSFSRRRRPTSRNT